MRLTRIELRNWRNFIRVDVPLAERVFLVGPNAAGKSNFLDALRFLHDVADPEGGLQRAIAARGGLDDLRSLHAPPSDDVVVEIEAVSPDGGDVWSYRLELGRNPSVAPLRGNGEDRPLVRREVVRRGEHILLERPDADDRDDASRLTQTHLEQVSANRAFRALREGFEQIRYLHIVPQLVREPDRSRGLEADPYGGDFVRQLGKLPRERFEARRRAVLEVLRPAVPQLDEIELRRGDDGTVHLRSRFTHWRGDAWQNEGRLSDGTLRLLGLVWVLLDGGPLLLEEPELSLHASVVRYLPLLFAQAAASSGAQILVSTHSTEFLGDEGIAAEEVLLFEPATGGSQVLPASADAQIRALVEGGLTLGEAVIPKTSPTAPDRMLRLEP